MLSRCCVVGQCTYTVYSGGRGGAPPSAPPLPPTVTVTTVPYQYLQYRSTKPPYKSNACTASTVTVRQRPSSVAANSAPPSSTVLPPPRHCDKRHTKTKKPHASALNRYNTGTSGGYPPAGVGAPDHAPNKRSCGCRTTVRANNCSGVTLLHPLPVGIGRNGRSIGARNPSGGRSVRWSLT